MTPRPSGFFFTDDWWDSVDDGFIPNNEWRTLSFEATNKAFSKIGFEIGWRTGTWDMAADSLEIDYIQITQPDSTGHWNAWSDPCSAATCPIAATDLTDQSWLQYRLDLQTDDRSTTPTVSQVGLHTRHATSGTYTAPTETFTRSQDLLTFDADVTTPTSTNVTFEYTTNGRTWLPITPGDTFPSDTRATNLQWRATLTTSDPTVSPQIHRVTIDHTPYRTPTTGTSAAGRAAQLESQGKQTEANALRERYPDMFSDTPDTPGSGGAPTPQQEIVRILTDTVRILERLVELQEEGETTTQ